MNLILISERDFVAADRVRLGDRRFDHVVKVHRAAVGDELRVGVVNGEMGSGRIHSLSREWVELEVRLDRSPPAPLPLTLYLALPRPKFLARCLQVSASLGVKDIYLFNSFKVDKVYWNCQQITPEEINEACLLGLAQSRDTILPRVHLRPRFKPFVEDELPSLCVGTKALVAHPTAANECPRGDLNSQISLAIGPEGGFIDYEIEKLSEAGFTPVRLTERILKVETAISTLIGRVT